MTTVRSDMSVSLDGFVCGPEASRPPYLDDGFFRVTSWITQQAAWRERHGASGGDTQAGDELIAEMFAQAGAYVMGRRMFDSGEEPWGEEPPFGAPVFVVTHRAREPLARKGGTIFHFVTDGLAAAVERAKSVAGDRKVAISGGADIVTQAIAAGLLDELHLHIAPVLLGAGTRLFDGLPAGLTELDRFRLVDAAGMTHISYRIATTDPTGGSR